MLYYSQFDVPVYLWTPLQEKRGKPDNYIPRELYFVLLFPFSMTKLLLGEFKSDKIYVCLQLLYYSQFDVPVYLWTPLQEKRGKPDNYIPRELYFVLLFPFSMTKLLLGEFKSDKIPLTTKNLDQVSAKCLLSFKRIREA